MLSDDEFRVEGMRALTDALGPVDSARFVSLGLREPVDYTKWRQYLFHGLTLEEISSEAQDLWEKNNKKESVS